MSYLITWKSRAPPKIALVGSPKKAKRKHQKMIHVAVSSGRAPAVVWGQGAGGGAGRWTWGAQAADLGEECQGRRSHLPGSSAGRNKSVFTKARHIWQVTVAWGRTALRGYLTYGNGGAPQTLCLGGLGPLLDAKHPFSCLLTIPPHSSK